VSANDLRNPITIQTPTAATDGSPTVASWSTFHKTRAHKKESARGESMRGVMVTAIRGTVYTIRYKSGITPQMRIVDGSTTRNITDVVDPDNGRREWLVISCLEDEG
jgi:head-tail adaptor